MSAALLDAAFGTRDVYEIVGVARDADAGSVRKAYLKRALKLHPDKAGGDADKFRGLTLAYEILKDAERREAFDRDGDIVEDDASEGASASAAAWDDYWRALYKRVTTEDIEAYKADYIGSAEEREDALQAYSATGGVLEAMMSHIIAEDEDAESRVSLIIADAVRAGALEAAGDFAGTGAKAAAGVKTGARKRGKATRAAAKGSGAASKRAADGAERALADAIRGSRAKRAAMVKSEEAEAAAAAKSMGMGDGEEGLALAIARRSAARGDGLGAFAARYGVALDGFDAASDAAFAGKKQPKRKSRK